MAKEGKSNEGTDPLANDVSIAAKIEERGLSLNAKSRFVSAVDRLLGALTDIPIAHLEGIAARTRAKNDKKLDDLKDQPSDALDSLIIDIETSQKTADSLENKVAVVRGSVEYLEDSPEIRDVNSDWLNDFSRYAEHATSEAMRDIWSRILAGKVNGKNDFSTATLKVVSSLDINEAQAFQNLVNRSVDRNFVPAVGMLEGVELNELMLAEACGLIQGSYGLLSKSFRLSRQKNGKLLTIIVQEKHGLVLEAKKEFSVSGAFFTKAGKELATILPEPDEIASLRRLFEACKEKVDSAQIVLIVSKEGSSFTWSPFEVLK